METSFSGERHVVAFPPGVTQDQAVKAVVAAGRFEVSGRCSGGELLMKVRSMVGREGNQCVLSGVACSDQEEVWAIQKQLRQGLRQTACLSMDEVIRRMEDHTLPEPARGMGE